MRLPLRAESSGSSANAVPAPTITASLRDLAWWTHSRDAGPVIHRDSPAAVAIRPSSVVASFSVTKGRPFTHSEINPRCCFRHSSSSTPTSTSIPALRSTVDPRPFTRACGSLQPTITRRMPASIIAFVHGGVRPVKQQGSRVVAMLAPRTFALPCFANGLCQCHGFRMRTTRRLGGSTTEHRRTPKNNRPNCGIRVGGPKNAPRLTERKTHCGLWRHDCFSSSRSSLVKNAM